MRLTRLLHRLSDEGLLYLLVALITLVLCLCLGAAVWGCGGAQFGGGSIYAEYHDDTVYATVVASGSAGSVQAMPVVSLTMAPEWTSLDAEFIISIKGLLSVGATLECLFPHSEDEPMACEVCVESMCFWLPASPVASPPKPDPQE